MRIIVTGRGTSGSWQIRAVQLGAAIGATVEANVAKIRGFDLCVIVKRCPPDLLHRIRQAGVPIVYDVVDGWPQGASGGGNLWNRDQCMQWLRGQVAHLRPAALVCATQAMQADCKEFGLPTIALPHHCRPGQAINPIRERVQKVAYEGSVSYLGPWQRWLEVECAARGWEFVTAPLMALADVDIAVAVREATGYAPRHWKSGVKLANAQGSGTPIICNREAGYTETATGGELFADTRAEMVAALDQLTDHETRKVAASGLWPPMIHVVAATYREWLERLKL